MYAWGDLQGYASPDEYSFDQSSYIAKGLNNISSSLSEQQDAATNYYGSIAHMPSNAQLRELYDNTTITQNGNLFTIRSNINGNHIQIYGRGQFIGSSSPDPFDLYIWSKTYYTNTEARCFRKGERIGTGVTGGVRWHGMLILPVKSS